MDSEFVNAFISRQKALIDDLQSRLLLSETHHQILKTRLEQANDTIEQLNKKILKKSNNQDA